MYFILLRWNSPVSSWAGLPNMRFFWGGNWCFSFALSFHANSFFQYINSLPKNTMFFHAERATVMTFFSGKIIFSKMFQNNHYIHCPKKHKTLSLDFENSRKLHVFCNSPIFKTNHKKETCKNPRLLSKIEPFNKQIPSTAQDHQIWEKSSVRLVFRGRVPWLSFFKMRTAPWLPQQRCHP